MLAQVHNVGREYGEGRMKGRVWEMQCQVFRKADQDRMWGEQTTITWRTWELHVVCNLGYAQRTIGGENQAKRPESGLTWWM